MIYASFKANSYILQVIENLIGCPQTFDYFLVHIELLVKGVKGRHGVGSVR